MKPLNEVPWEDLRALDCLISACGTHGFLMNTIDESLPGKSDIGKRMVFMKWDDGSSSYEPHVSMDTVTWVSEYKSRSASD